VEQTAVQYEIYGREDCVYCEKAKELLDRLKRPYKYIEIGKDISLKEFKVKFPFAKTVPQICHDFFHIGGFNDLELYLWP